MEPNRRICTPRRQTSEPHALPGSIVMLQLFSIGLAVTLITVVVLMRIVLARRPIAVDKLGSVSDRWIAQHRVD
jgi:cytochrome c biogenesis protein CcdA